METNFNIGSLKIVSAPLMEYFKKIQANLNENIQVINDKKIPSNFESIDVLKKVNGTLKMLGLTGVNKVLFSISTALEQVKSARFDTNKSLAVLEASLQITTSIVFYLENLLKGEQDQPTKLFDEYSKINNLLGNKVYVKDLFTPKLDFKRGAVSDLQYALRLGVVLKADSREKIVPFLEQTSAKVNDAVEVIVGLIDGGKFNSFEEKEYYQSQVKDLYTAADNIQKLNLSKGIYLLGSLQKLFISIVSPVFNDNFTDLISSQAEVVKNNLRGFSTSVQSLKTAVEKLSLNDKTGTIKANDEVVCDVLYFVLQVLNDSQNSSLKNMPVYQEVSSLFDLDFYASQLVNTKVEVSLSQSNPEAAAQIDKLFVEMKEELSLLTSKQASVDTFFQQHSAKFLSNATKLNELMAPVATPRWKELNDLVASCILAIKNKQLEFSETLQKEVSLSLVLVEYGIGNFVKLLLSNAQKADFELQATLQINRLEAARSGRFEDLNTLARPVLDAGSQKADERKSMLVIFEKLSKDLKKSEEILNDIFRDPTNTEDLPVVFKTLNSAKGIFAIIKRTEFSEILTDVISIWKQVGEHGIDVVNKEDLSNSVGLLSGILLYAEATKNDNEIEANEIFLRVMAAKNKGQEEVGATFVLPGEEVAVVPEKEEVVEETPVVKELTFAVEPVFETVEVAPAVEVAPVVETTVAEDYPVYVDRSEDDELLEVYLMEAEEVLENISGALVTLNANPTNAEELTNIRRYFHTLKGSGRMVGLDYLGEAGWMVEQTLNKVISGDLSLSPAMLAELESIRLSFLGWKAKIEQTKEVEVDLIGLKQKWLAVNPNLMTKLDIPDVVVAPVAQVVPVEEVVEVAPVEEFTFTTEPVEETVEESPVVEEFAFTTEEIVEEAPLVEEVVEEAQAEEVQFVEETVEVKAAPEVREFININGVDVTESLYNIYKEETEVHLKALRDSVRSHVYADEGFEVTYEFMRHAHTLGSISKSVNMDVFAEFVVKIEFVANTCLDRKLFLKADQFNVLKNSVENLDLFSNIIDGSLATNEHFLMLGERLQGLLNFLTSVEEEIAPIQVEVAVQEPVVQSVEFENKEEELNNNETDKEQEAPVAPVQNFDMTETVEAVALKVGEVLDEKLSALKEDKSSVEQVNHSTSEQVQEVKEAVHGLPESLNVVIEKHFEKVTEVINENNAVHAEEVKSLKEEVSVLKEEIEQLQREQKESFDELKRYMRHLNSALKKKSNLTNSGVVRFEEERQPVIVEQVAVEAVEDAVAEVTSQDVVEEETDEVLVDHKFSGSKFISGVEPVAEEVVAEEVIAEEVVAEEVVAEEVVAEEVVAEEVIAEEVIAEEVVAEEVVAEEAFSLDFDTPAPVAVAPVISSIGVFLAANPFVKTIYEEKVSTVEDELDGELFEIAQMETDELMEAIEVLLENVQSPEINLEQNKELKRHLHTLKGSVRMAGANKVGAIAHRLESLLDYSESRGISLFTMKELLEDELKKIAFMLKNVEVPLSSDNLSWIDGKYDVETKVEVEAVENTENEVNPQVQKNTFVQTQVQSIRIDANIIDDLINNAGEVRLTRTTLEGMLISNRRSLADLRASSDKLISMLKEIEVQAETQIAAKKELEATSENFDPLEFDRFTRLQELTRFMNETVADVQDTVTSMETFLKTQDSAIVQQSNLTNNLLDTLMKIRLVPIDTISDRLYKITRNTAKEVGKRVALELQGEKTEIDRLVLDKVISPIEHLLRNSIAHGIETPEERTASGKTVAGKVSFNISVDGNFIMLSIKDDGAGINVDKVRSIAIKRGLLKMGVDYTEKQIVDMIFQSGFSTADTVSQVSGRGVGLDVVKKEISELGGSIDIVTARGQGTEFKIILPVSVATNHVMLINVADKLVGIPALNVEEVFSLKRNQIQKAYQDGKVTLKGREYPMFYFGHLLGLVQVNQLPEFRTYNTLIAVNYLGDTVVVHIDAMEATTEVLIKSMGSHYSKINGILGATLLGDGRQGIIVNPVSLRKHYEQNIKQSVVDNINDTMEEVEKSGVITVMVVDDSITVRRATSKVLQRYGYNVVLAKDGEDGLEQLQIVTPDIILSDIEMPRMDGFEFAKNVKNTEKYAGIPIIMITSRTADKHKNYAFSLGVEGFLGKPYQEEELIANITELVQRTVH